MCGSQNIASASVRGFWPQIRVRRQMLCRIRCQSASPQLTFWPLPHRPQPQPCVQAMWVSLGHWSTINSCSCGAWSVTEGLTEIKRVRQHYSICSLCSAGELAECRAWVNDPRQFASANFQVWAIRGRCEKLADASAAASTHLWLLQQLMCLQQTPEGHIFMLQA